MRKVELLPTRDCEAGYGPAKERTIYENFLVWSFEDNRLLQLAAVVI